MNRQQALFVSWYPQQNLKKYPTQQQNKPTKHLHLLTDIKIPALLNLTKGYLTSFCFNCSSKVTDLHHHSDDAELVL